MRKAVFIQANISVVMRSPSQLIILVVAVSKHPLLLHLAGARWYVLLTSSHDVEAVEETKEQKADVICHLRALKSAREDSELLFFCLLSWF